MDHAATARSGRRDRLGKESGAQEHEKMRQLPSRDCPVGDCVALKLGIVSSYFLARGQCLIDVVRSLCANMTETLASCFITVEG
jgi:hypothetical protein